LIIMRTHIKFVTAVICAATLSACATPPVSDAAGPGAIPADPSAAGLLFANTCMATAPQFAGLPAAVASYPFTQNARTGTYYHNQQNLSIKRLGQGADGYCSMVVGSDKSMADTAVAFSEAVTATNPVSGTSITLGAGPQVNGLSYFNARIDAQ